MRHQLVILLSWATGLWPTPALSFTSPSRRNHPPVFRKEAPPTRTNWRRERIGGMRGTKTQRSMLLPSISISTIHNNLPMLQNRALARTVYFLLANTIYICRRSNIRNMSKRKLLRIRLDREDGVSLPLYLTNILAWQMFVNFVFPLLELVSRLFGYVSFYYFYPNARGCGESSSAPIAAALRMRRA